MRIHQISFDLRPRTEPDAPIEVIPRIDGLDLTDLVHAFERETGMETRSASYGGLIPARFRFGPMDRHFLGQGDSMAEGKMPLLGCECGEWGCWPLHARITVTEDVVTWDAFEHRGLDRDYSAFGPFSFDRVAYGRALTAFG